MSKPDLSQLSKNGKKVWAAVESTDKIFYTNADTINLENNNHNRVIFFNENGELYWYPKETLSELNPKFESAISNRPCRTLVHYIYLGENSKKKCSLIVKEYLSNNQVERRLYTIEEGKGGKA